MLSKKFAESVPQIQHVGVDVRGQIELEKQFCGEFVNQVEGLFDKLYKVLPEKDSESSGSEGQS